MSKNIMFIAVLFSIFSVDQLYAEINLDSETMRTDEGALGGSVQEEALTGENREEQLKKYRQRLKETHE